MVLRLETDRSYAEFDVYMEPLDLGNKAPRPARMELAGVVFLPRTIDKARAALSQGNLGAYRLAGFSEDMLDEFGIALSDFLEVVRMSVNEDDVAAYVTTHAKAGSIADWNAYVSARKPFDGDRAKQLAVFPFLADRPDLTTALEILDEDDRQLFLA